MDGRRISNELVGILAVGLALAGLTLVLNGGLEAQIERLDGRVDRIEVRMHSTNERLARLEGRIEGLGYLTAMLPAHAGMNRIGGRPTRKAPDVPRTRGDEPGLD